MLSGQGNPAVQTVQPLPELADGWLQRSMAEDVRYGLTQPSKKLPPKYFYDSTGSALFDEITRLPEYYLTRVELGILDGVAEELMAEVKPAQIVELGSGLSTKVRRLLDTAGARQHLARYVPFDVDESVIDSSIESVSVLYPELATSGVVGDFERHLDQVPERFGTRLVVFFGSTIGNLDPDQRRAFLDDTRRLLASEDRLLLGIDLVKERDVLEAAYNDSAGVTARFNQNILRVINRGLDANFEPTCFEHEAFFNEQESRIEMHLRPYTHQVVDLGELAMTVEVSPNETIWTESSYKFTRGSVDDVLGEAGLEIERWMTDDIGRFALVLARPA